MNLTGAGELEQLLGPCATANWFALQREQAMLGRTFLPDEDQHGRNHVVVLDHGYEAVSVLGASSPAVRAALTDPAGALRRY
jgi:hypothetical protein